MVTGFEGAGLKALIDAIVSVFDRARSQRITEEGKAALERAIREHLGV